LARQLAALRSIGGKTVTIQQISTTGVTIARGKVSTPASQSGFTGFRLLR
jgi:hypothetical protein